LGGRFAKAVYKTSCKVSSAFSLYHLPNAAGAVGMNAFRLSKKWLFAITGGAVETSISILKGYSYLGYAATAYDLLCRMPR
jgi:hypothetical protein